MITHFCGEYRFLSNFHPSPVVLDGVTYPTVEHAYQAAKSSNPHYRDSVRYCETPGQAKKRGQKIPLRSDWEQVKVEIMRDLLKQKFIGSEFERKLIDTGNEDLVEENYWGDKFWGQCPLGDGLNLLGKLLMEIRTELTAKPYSCYE